MDASNLSNFAMFVLNLAILAVVLCVSGYCVSKFIKSRQQSRFDSMVNSAAAIARARSHARALQKTA